ncbi:SMP-30/gluconolactonase/LRE family protein [Herbaspirillum lusitanum]|uniref:SMP-30/gluconolactonase/LRE family protein n=1 Tax=Herbaspirillum lusitanum TaxID=213312 RepID=UPI002238E539|nr:SMP-30/gluconolactonase/LRE family protein [Herbaspirillum lusitanum]MCW5296744.1 SMP-30/gluconolactonase/LRE family protein [Herbaspirillum lusitanum]
MQVLPLNDQRYDVAESPFWHAAQSAWYWVDIPRKLICRQTADGDCQQWQLPEMVACIAPDDDGGLIAGMHTGIFSVRLQDDGHAQLSKLAQPAGLQADQRFNDGRCDRQGRFWSGVMCLDMSLARADGKLYRYDDAGLSAPMADGLIVQNGLAWSPDGKTMYLSDSHPSRRLVWAFDYDVDSGTPSRRRVFADLNHHRGRPDGAAMDVDGCYWICANDAGCVLRFTPDGKLDRTIELPAKKPSMCAFGGDDMKTMIVASISLGAPTGDDGAGRIWTLNPGVAGMRDAPFAKG